MAHIVIIYKTLGGDVEIFMEVLSLLLSKLDLTKYIIVTGFLMSTLVKVI